MQMALARYQSDPSTFPWHDPSYQDPTFLAQVLRINGMELEHVWHPTRELCLIALQNTPKALWWIPYHMCTPELCNIAVRRDSSMIRYVPEEVLPFL